MQNRMTRIYLFIAGLLIVAIGAYISLEPVGYMTGLMASPGLSPSVNMLSDLRGMGGLLLLSGVVAMIAAFRRGWDVFALPQVTLVYVSFVVFRGLGVALEGLPESAILIAWLIEFVMAALGLLLVVGRPIVGITLRPQEL